MTIAHMLFMLLVTEGARSTHQRRGSLPVPQPEA